MSAFDQSWNIGDDECFFTAVERDHAQLRFERREWIIGDFGTGGRDSRNQSGFADVGISDQANIGKQLQLEAERLLFTMGAVLRFVRSAIDG